MLLSGVLESFKHASFVLYLMRKILIFCIALFTTVSVTAKTMSESAVSGTPRSIGFRIGASGFDATYQHVFRKNQFLQGDFGVDFGYNANGRPGFRATGVYNFVWARPAWTHKGYWGIYSGPGLSLGYVNDMVSYRVGDEVKYTLKDHGANGFMIGLAVQVGLEYTFEFPLSLAMEVRPVFGMHLNSGVEIGGERYGGKVGFYDNGMVGFVPSLAVRYKF